MKDKRKLSLYERCWRTINPCFSKRDDLHITVWKNIPQREDIIDIYSGELLKVPVILVPQNKSNDARKVTSLGEFERWINYYRDPTYLRNRSLDDTFNKSNKIVLPLIFFLKTGTFYNRGRLVKNKAEGCNLLYHYLQTADHRTNQINFLNLNEQRVEVHKVEESSNGYSFVWDLSIELKDETLGFTSPQYKIGYESVKGTNLLIPYLKLLNPDEQRKYEYLNKLNEPRKSQLELILE